MGFWTSWKSSLLKFPFNPNLTWCRTTRRQWGVQQCQSRGLLFPCGRSATVVVVVLEYVFLCSWRWWLWYKMLKKPETWKIRRESSRRCHQGRQGSTLENYFKFIVININTFPKQWDQYILSLRWYPFMISSHHLNLTCRSRPNFCGSSTLETHQGLHPL